MASQADGSEHEFPGGLATNFDLEFTAWEGSAARGWSGARSAAGRRRVAADQATR